MYDQKRLEEIIVRLEDLERRVAQLENKKTKKPKEKSGFNWKALYDMYPARDGAHNMLGGFRILSKTVKTIEDYDAIRRAILNYTKALSKDHKIGTKFVISFCRFVDTAWVDWTDKSLTKPVSIMSDEDLYGV